MVAFQCCLVVSNNKEKCLAGWVLSGRSGFLQRSKKYAVVFVILCSQVHTKAMTTYHNIPQGGDLNAILKN